MIVVKDGVTQLGRSQFRKLMKQHPRVRFHTEPTSCTALTSSRTTVTGYNDPTSVSAAARSLARCKSEAHWEFKKLRSSLARSGDYCWTHLLERGVYYDKIEEIATRRWITQRLAPL